MKTMFKTAMAVIASCAMVLNVAAQQNNATIVTAKKDTINLNDVQVVRFGQGTKQATQSKDTINLNDVQIVRFGQGTKQATQSKENKTVTAHVAERNADGTTTKREVSIAVVNYEDLGIATVSAQEALEAMKTDNGKLVFVGNPEKSNSKSAFALSEEGTSYAEKIKEKYPNKETKIYLISNGDRASQSAAYLLISSKKFDKQQICVIKGGEEQWLNANPQDRK